MVRQLVSGCNTHAENINMKGGLFLNIDNNSHNSSITHYLEIIKVHVQFLGVQLSHGRIKRTGYNVGGGAPFILMKVAQWRMKPKNRLPGMKVPGSSALCGQ